MYGQWVIVPVDLAQSFCRDQRKLSLLRAYCVTIAWYKSMRGRQPTQNKRFTNETRPLPLCTVSVMDLSMCSSIFSESSSVRSKSNIINELSGFWTRFHLCDVATPAPADIAIPVMHIAFALYENISALCRIWYQNKIWSFYFHTEITRFHQKLFNDSPIR